jgi:hypothetical protein
MISVQKQYSLSHSISVNKTTCEYTGKIKFNAPKANVPFPTCPLVPPPPSPSKTPPSYKFGGEFYKATGFDHLGLDWYPCGHGAPTLFGKAHLDFHLYRITPAQRDVMTCNLTLTGTKCDDTSTQTTAAGRKFFALGTVAAPALDKGKNANMPELFIDVGAALPHTGIHFYAAAGRPTVADWTEPMLMMGSYDSKIAFWEPMIPYSFVNGTAS